MQYPQGASPDVLCGGNMQYPPIKQLKHFDRCSSSVTDVEENSHYGVDGYCIPDGREGHGGETDELEQDDEAGMLWLSAASMMSSLSALTTASPLTIAASSLSLNASVNLFASKSSYANGIARASIDRVSRIPRRWTIASAEEFSIKTRELMINDDLEQDNHLTTERIYQRRQTIIVSNRSTESYLEFSSSRRPDPPGSHALVGINSPDTLFGGNMQDLLSTKHVRDTGSCSSTVSNDERYSYHGVEDYYILDGREVQRVGADDLEQDDEAGMLWQSSSLISSLSWNEASLPTLSASRFSFDMSMDLFAKSSCSNVNSRASIDRVSQVPRRWTIDSGKY